MEQLIKKYQKYRHQLSLQEIQVVENNLWPVLSIVETSEHKNNLNKYVADKIKKYLPDFIEKMKLERKRDGNK